MFTTSTLVSNRGNTLVSISSSFEKPRPSGIFPLFKNIVVYTGKTLLYTHTHEPLLDFLMAGNTFGIPGSCNGNVTGIFQSNDEMPLPRIGLKRNVLKPGCP